MKHSMRITGMIQQDMKAEVPLDLYALFRGMWASDLCQSGAFHPFSDT